MRDILQFLRVKPDYWIINSEVYLDMMANNSALYYDDKYENKDLTAIYNFIYQKQKDSIYNSEKGLGTEISVEENAFKRYFKINIITDIQDYICSNENISQIFYHPEYPRFIKFIEKDLFYEINETNKSIFDPSIVYHIYNYFSRKYEKFISNKINQINLQNLILFFSLVEYDSSLDYIWNGKNDQKSNNISQASKKYSLRLSRISEEEIEKNYISDQIKIFQINELITSLKQREKILDFIKYLEKNNVNYIKYKKIIFRRRNIFAKKKN
jgi:hypothetical protein